MQTLNTSAPQISMSFDEFDKLCTELESLIPCDYCPTRTDALSLTEQFSKYFSFILYIVEYHTSMDECTKEEKDVMHELRTFLYDNLELTE